MERDFIDWIIHMVIDDSPAEYIGNSHTHGMQNYKHLDFQLVINYGKEEVMRLLNTMGLKVKAGERFKHGDKIKGLYEDCDIRLDLSRETGRDVLRLIIPDEKNRWPEDPDCSEPYKYQTLKFAEGRAGNVLQ